MFLTQIENNKQAAMAHRRWVPGITRFTFNSLSLRIHIIVI